MFDFFRGFFIGCFRNIKYGPDNSSMMPVDDIDKLRSHVTPGNCSLTLCDKRRKICKNNGVCVPSGESSATCNCTLTGYHGSTCTEGESKAKKIFNRVKTQGQFMSLLSLINTLKK